MVCLDQCFISGPNCPFSDKKRELLVGVFSKSGLFS